MAIWEPNQRPSKTSQRDVSNLVRDGLVEMAQPRANPPSPSEIGGPSDWIFLVGLDEVGRQAVGLLRGLDIWACRTVSACRRPDDTDRWDIPGYPEGCGGLVMLLAGSTGDQDLADLARTFRSRGALTVAVVLAPRLDRAGVGPVQASPQVESVTGSAPELFGNPFLRTAYGREVGRWLECLVEAADAVLVLPLDGLESVADPSTVSVSSGCLLAEVMAPLISGIAEASNAPGPFCYDSLQPILRSAGLLFLGRASVAPGQNLADAIRSAMLPTLVGFWPISATTCLLLIRGCHSSVSLAALDEGCRILFDAMGPDFEFEFIWDQKDNSVEGGSVMILAGGTAAHNFF